MVVIYFLSSIKPVKRWQINIPYTYLSYVLRSTTIPDKLYLGTQQQFLLMFFKKVVFLFAEYPSLGGSGGRERNEKEIKLVSFPTFLTMIIVVLKEPKWYLY